MLSLHVFRSAFGNDNCIRISYATSENILIEGINRIKNQLEQLL